MAAEKKKDKDRILLTDIVMYGQDYLTTGEEDTLSCIGLEIDDNIKQSSASQFIDNIWTNKLEDTFRVAFALFLQDCKYIAEKKKIYPIKDNNIPNLSKNIPEKKRLGLEIPKKKERLITLYDYFYKKLGVPQKNLQPILDDADQFFLPFFINEYFRVCKEQNNMGESIMNMSKYDRLLPYAMLSYVKYSRPGENILWNMIEHIPLPKILGSRRNGSVIIFPDGAIRESHGGFRENKPKSFYEKGIKDAISKLDYLDDDIAEVLFGITETHIDMIKDTYGKGYEYKETKKKISKRNLNVRKL